MTVHSLALYLTLLLPAGTPSIRVDFTKVLHPVSPLTFGLDISGYGGDQAFPRDAREQQLIKALHPGVMRTGLRYAVPGDPTSRFHCAGRGCATDIPGDEFVKAIKAVGGEPVVMTVVYNGAEEQSVTDAVNLLKHFNVETRNPVKRWLIGNEPDNKKMRAEEYAHQFNRMYDAMKAIDPTIKIGGPTTASFNVGFLKTFLENCGSRVDFVDFHGYGEGGKTDRPEAQLLEQTSKYDFSSPSCGR